MWMNLLDQMSYVCVDFPFETAKRQIENKIFTNLQSGCYAFI